MTEPYWTDGAVSLFLGDCREVIPELVAQGIQADCIIADMPYGETPLAWDRWPDGWLEVAAQASRSLWCFGSMKLLGTRWHEFTAAGWKFSQDVVWEKGNGSGVSADRFRRVHENAAHWYRGRWGDICHDTPRVPATAEQIARNGTALRAYSGRSTHIGKHGVRQPWTEDGTRLMRSVIQAKSRRGAAINPTEKPPGILAPLITYACPPGGLLIDPAAGSCSSLMAARMTGRRAIGIELREEQAEEAARWLCQGDLFGGAA